MFFFLQSETIKGDTRLTINRRIRQVEDNSTTKLTDQIIETTTKLMENSEISTSMYEYEDEDEKDLPTTISSINEKTKTTPEKKRSTKDKLDAFLAGPLIIVGAISLVSLCLFLLYVCKYRSTGSRVDFTIPTA